MQLLVSMQEPSQRRPAGQYSKGQAPLRQSPAAAGSHTHLAVITAPPAPPVLNNLAGVSPASAPPHRVRPPSVCQQSDKHALFVVGAFFFHSLIGPARLGTGAWRGRRGAELRFGRDGGRESLNATPRWPCFLSLHQVLVATTHFFLTIFNYNDDAGPDNFRELQLQSA